MLGLALSFNKQFATFRIIVVRLSSELGTGVFWEYFLHGTKNRRNALSNDSRKHPKRMSKHDFV
jgi:hypothetical protein